RARLHRNRHFRFKDRDARRFIPGRGYRPAAAGPATGCNPWIARKTPERGNKTAPSPVPVAARDVSTRLIRLRDHQGSLGMLTTTRRGLVIGAGLAGMAFGLDKRLAFIAPAQAQKTPDPASGFHTYKVGAATL